MSEKIPLSIPNLAGNELKYLQECVETNFVSSVGPFVNRFEKAIAEFVGVKHAIATVNGTAALHIALILCDVGPTDEVLAPNLTFIAPCNAISYTGAKPIFIDSCWKTMGMDPKKLESFLSANTKIVNGQCINQSTQSIVKAVIPMHTLGNAVEIQEILAVAKKYHLKVIEDSCEALGTRVEGKHVGTFGLFGALSFNGNKVITSGGGGMLLTNDDHFASRARHLTTTAKTDPLEFFHDEVGYNYRLVNPLAAIGLAQLEQLEGLLAIKKTNALLLKERIDQIAGLEICFPTQWPTNFWFYPLKVAKNFPLRKNELIKFLIEKDIEVRPIWTLMEDLPMFKNLQKGDTSASREIYDSIVCLPCSTNLSTAHIERIFSTLASIA